MSRSPRHIKPKHFRKMDGCPVCRREYLAERTVKRERIAQRNLRLEVERATRRGGTDRG